MGLYRLCLECIAYLRYCTVVQVFEIYVCVVRVAVAVFLLKFTYICVHVYERQDELMTLGRVIFCVLLAQAVGLTY